MTTKTPWVVAAVALCLPALVQAQADPAASRSPAPASGYQSAFADYKPFKDVAAGEWRAANQAVGGGAAPAAPAGRSSAPTASPASAPAAAASKPLAGASAAEHEGHHPPGGPK